MQGSLAGPIGPARYLLLALSGQQKIENLDKKVAILAENAAEIAKYIPCKILNSLNCMKSQMSYFIARSYLFVAISYR